MYFHFKPDCYYWILLILSRKLVIAMTSLMFNRNPAFQMAMCLLTLFIAYAAQVCTCVCLSMCLLVFVRVHVCVCARARVPCCARVLTCALVPRAGPLLAVHVHERAL